MVSRKSNWQMFNYRPIRDTKRKLLLVNVKQIQHVDNHREEKMMNEKEKYHLEGYREEETCNSLTIYKLLLNS